MTITRYVNIAKCSQFVHKNGMHDVEYINNNGQCYWQVKWDSESKSDKMPHLGSGDFAFATKIIHPNQIDRLFPNDDVARWNLQSPCNFSPIKTIEGAIENGRRVHKRWKSKDGHNLYDQLTQSRQYGDDQLFT